MRYFKLILLLIFFSFLSSFDNSPKATLEIDIYNLESNDGNVRVHLYSSDLKESFPNHPENAFKLKVVKINNRTAKAIFEDIPFGSYAYSIHHDANLNIKMDKNLLGLPSEGWGLSNDVLPVLKLPKFEACSISVNKTYVVSKVKVRN